MLSSSRVTRNFQITIPKEIRKQMPFLKEGDPVDFYLEDNKLIVIPKKKVPADQMYYWSSEWQEGMREAKEDVKEGRVSGPYKDVKVALIALKQSVKEIQ